MAAGNVTTFSRPGGSEYALSAPYSMRCCLYQAFAAFGSPLKTATAARRVTTTLVPAANGNAPSLVNSSFSSWVALSPRMTPILKSAQVAPSVVHTRTRWPSRKPSASQLEPSARTRRRLAVSKVALPVHRPWRASWLTTAAVKVPLAPVASVSVIVLAVTERIVRSPLAAPRPPRRMSCPAAKPSSRKEPTSVRVIVVRPPAAPAVTVPPNTSAVGA